jgi:hypothetical protein
MAALRLHDPKVVTVDGAGNTYELSVTRHGEGDDLATGSYGPRVYTYKGGPVQCLGGTKYFIAALGIEVIEVPLREK